MPLPHIAQPDIDSEDSDTPLLKKPRLIGEIPQIRTELFLHARIAQLQVFPPDYRSASEKEELFSLMEELQNLPRRPMRRSLARRFHNLVNKNKISAIAQYKASLSSEAL